MEVVSSILKLILSIHVPLVLSLCLCLSHCSESLSPHLAQNHSAAYLLHRKKYLYCVHHVDKRNVFVKCAC